MAILFCFIIQAVAYEYRKKPDNLYGERFYEILLYINGSLGIFLIGVALGTLYSGGNFVVNEEHLSHWTKATYGLEALTNPFNVAFGLMLVFLARIQGALYFMNNIGESTIVQRAKSIVKTHFVMFLILFLFVASYILFSTGLVYDPKTGVVSVEKMKFLHSFVSMPILLLLFAAGVLTLLYGIYIALVKNSKKAIWFTGAGTILTVTILMLILGINNSVFYPSLADIQSSLTIQNASGSQYTLTVMSYVSLLVPVVAAYIFFVWRSMDKKELTIEEIEADPHHY